MVRLVVLIAVAACTQHLPAPAAPAQAPPSLALPTTPVRSDYARAVVDVPEGPTKVDLYTGTDARRSRFPLFIAGSLVMATAVDRVDTFRHLCFTPCVVDLPRGSHELRFTLHDDADRSDRTVVTLTDPNPTIYLHTVGRDEPHRRGRIGASILLGLGGTVALFSPLPLVVDEGKIGAGMLVGGLVVGGLGAAIMYLSRPVKQPGASTQWVPAR